MKHQNPEYDERVQCIDGSIPDDEPVFLLRGKDPHAPAVIRSYAKRRFGPGITERAEIMDHADRMDQYRQSLPPEEKGKPNAEDAPKPKKKKKAAKKKKAD